MDERIEVTYRVHSTCGDFFYSVGECPDGLLTRISYHEHSRNNDKALSFVEITDDSLVLLHEVIGKEIARKGLQSDNNRV